MNNTKVILSDVLEFWKQFNDLCDIFQVKLASAETVEAFPVLKVELNNIQKYTTNKSSLLPL
jgi:hypothetical protein